MDSDEKNADDQLHVVFYTSDRTASRGKPYCRIMVPGNKELVWDQPVRESDKQRFPRQWLYFQQQTGGTPSFGTSLDVWREDNPSDIAQGHLDELKALRFQTVEQVATATDSQLQRLMGGVGLRLKAQEYLRGKIRKVDASELDSTKAELDELKKQVAALLAKPKPGRKPKSAEV